MVDARAATAAEAKRKEAVEKKKQEVMAAMKKKLQDEAIAKSVAVQAMQLVHAGVVVPVHAKTADELDSET